MVYSKKDSVVLIGNVLVRKKGYLATLCFMTEDDKFIDISLTKAQLVAMQEVISKGITIIENEAEKNLRVESEIRTIQDV